MSHRGTVLGSGVDVEEEAVLVVGAAGVLGASNLGVRVASRLDSGGAERQPVGEPPFLLVGLQFWPGQREPLLPRPFVLLPVVVGVPLVAVLPLEYVCGRVGPRFVEVPLLVVAAVVLSAVLV